KKLPQKTVEGTAGASPCGWLIIDTGDAHLIFRMGTEFEIRPPAGSHFANFNPCLNFDGFRMRITYTAPTGRGYDGDFHIARVLAAVAPGKGDDVPRFLPGPNPAERIGRSKPAAKWTAPSKPWANADGVVTSVVCFGRNLTLVLDHSGFTLTLHTDNYM